MPPETKLPELSFTWIFVDCILLGLFALWVIFLLSRFTFLHWSKYGVSYLTPYFPAGNINDFILGDKSISNVFQELYELAKTLAYKVSGIYLFSRPGIIITDPELIKIILVNDFDHFQDRGMFYDGIHDPIAAYMSLHSGSKWKHVHTELSNTFTDELHDKLFTDYREHIEHVTKSLLPLNSNSDIVNLNTAAMKLIAPIFGHTAFGLKYDSEFNESFKKLDDGPFSKVVTLRKFVSGVYPLLSVAHWVWTCIRPDKTLANLVDGLPENKSDYFDKFWQKIQLCDDSFGRKYENEKENMIRKYQFLQNCFQLFKPLIVFAFYELAMNLDVQDKLRKEINKLCHKIDDITYQTSKKFTYLDLVIKELLRKYPVNPLVERTCIKDYKVPDSKEIINRGSLIFIPVIGIHHDAEYYTMPEEFDPERFAADKTIRDFTYLPFGAGKRSCMGKNVALLPLKLALIVTLKSYELNTCSVTPATIEMDPNTHYLTTKHDLWLKISKI